MERNNGAVKVERLLRMPPVLVVGLGGVGHRIVLYLKALLVGLFGEVPAGMRLLVIDIDVENLVVPVGGRPVALEPGTELHCIGPIPVARIRQNLDNWPTIRARLGLALEANLWVAVATAAHMLRPLGQLAFQWQIGRVKQAVSGALFTLARRDQQGDGTGRLVDPGQGFKVFVVGSLVGGTHSGMFIDVAALIRAELETLGMAADASVVVGIGMLPGAFRGVDGPNLVPNTVFALEELDRVVSSGRFTAEYRNGTRIDLAHAPFDLYLMVDGVDESGRAWASRDDLSRMVARAVWLLAASRLGEQNDAILDNLLAALHGQTPDGHCKIFGSLGWSAIMFPAQRIIRLCGARHGREAIGFLVGVPAAETVAEEVAVWTQALGLMPEAVLEVVGQEESGVPMAVDVAMPTFLATAPEEQVPQAAIQYVADYRRLHLEGDYRTQSRRQAQALGEELAAGLRARAADVALELGIAHVAAVLAALVDHLAEVQRGLQGRRQAATAEVDRLGPIADQRAEALRRAAEGSWPFRRGRVTAACQRYFEACQALESARLEALLLERAVAAIGAAHDAALGLSRAYQAVTAQLWAVDGRLAQVEQAEMRALDSRTGNPALTVVDLATVDALYAASQVEPATTARAMLAEAGMDGVPAWAAADVESLATWALELSVRPFAHVAEISVEEVIRQWGGISAETRRAALLEDARPSWTYDPARLGAGDEPRRIVVLGVEDQERSLYRGDDALGISVVSTGDRHTITALALAAGVPATALQGWPDWERIAHDSRRNPVLYRTMGPHPSAL